MKDLGLQLRNEMITNAISYNKHLTKEYLTQKSTAHLMALTSPAERQCFDDRHFKLYGHRISTAIYEN